MTDEELKAQFAQINAQFVHVVDLITATKESLEREIHKEVGSVREEVAGVRDLMVDIQRRLDRQAGLLQTGARQTTRFIQWSEQVDVTLEDLRARVQALEQKKSNGSQGS